MSSAVQPRARAAQKRSPKASSRGRKVQRRSDNRRDELLRAAAKLFSLHGFGVTSMRDIANEVGMLAGSMYYHFPAKDDLILAAHRQGVDEILAGIDRALGAIEQDGADSAWARLEAACVAHLECLLGDSDTAGVIAIDLAQLSQSLRERLVEHRDEYEQRFDQLLRGLNLAPEVDRRLLRLSLLGALNWTPTWYRADRSDSPADIARHLVRTTQLGAAPR